MGQILITALVVSVFYFWWRYQQQASLGDKRQTECRSRQAVSSARKKPPFSLRALILGLAIAALIASGAYAVYDWRDKHQLLEVTLTNSLADRQQTYLVYKKDLQEKAFTTREGQYIRIANSDRLQVKPARAP